MEPMTNGNSRMAPNKLRLEIAMTKVLIGCRMSLEPRKVRRSRALTVTVAVRSNDMYQPSPIRIGKLIGDRGNSTSEPVAFANSITWPECFAGKNQKLILL